MPAGYSGTRLVDKLGIKQGYVVALLNAPEGYDVLLGTLPVGVSVVRGLKGELDLIQFFATEEATLRRAFPGLKASMKEGGVICVSWPKRSSEMQSDLGDEAARACGLKNGLVDVKVCTVDDTWSALKFVRRSKDRGG